MSFSTPRLSGLSEIKLKNAAKSPSELMPAVKVTNTVMVVVKVTNVVLVIVEKSVENAVET